jgi:hypothetical protein
VVEYRVSALAEEFEKEVVVELPSEVWIGELWWSREKEWTVVWGIGGEWQLAPQNALVSRQMSPFCDCRVVFEGMQSAWMKCSDFLEMDLLCRGLGGLARNGHHRVTSNKYYYWGILKFEYMYN